MIKKKNNRHSHIMMMMLLTTTYHYQQLELLERLIISTDVTTTKLITMHMHTYGATLGIPVNDGFIARPTTR